MKRLCTLLLLYLGFVSVTLSQECDINELVVEPTECENGLFFVHIDFNVLNPDGDLFGVMGNGTDYGSFPYDSLPIVLGPLEGDGTTEYEFVVFDENNPDCQAVFILGIVSCCGFNEIVIDPTECTNQEVFNAILNFNHFGTGGVGFDVFNANGGFIGFYEYENLPVTVTGIPSNGGGFTHITICDNDNADCCRVVEFEGLDCNTEDCEIFNVDLFVSECENGQFFVTLNFNYENVSDNFTVNGNGNNYGTFSYGNLPIVLGPFEGDGETIYEFVVHDAQFDGCSDFAVLEPVQCGQACGFDEVNIDPIECLGDGYYILGLNFIPVGTGDNFSVYSQNVFLGSFAYDELPVFIDSFPASCDFFDVVTICDNADSTCCETFEFQALLCCEDCLIYDLIAEVTECDSNNQFYVVLNFEYLNVSDEGFTVGGNGNNYGNFEYADLPITLGPFNGDGTINYEFAVSDLVNDGCFDAIDLGFVNCSCGFEEIVVDVLECTGNGTYAISLDFVPVGVTNDGFDVYAGNEFVGFYLYENLPVTIENFPDFAGEVDVITICDNDNPTCCTSFEFEEGLNCACDIFELSVDASECDPETNTFYIVVNFGWSGDAETFNVYKGDNLIGTVVGANLPDTIYGLTDNGGGALFSVCATNYPDCCAAVEVSVPDCGACDILELVAEPFNCDPEDNTFDLYLDFAWEGNVETFDVFMGDDFIGVVEGANLPDTLTGLVDDGGGALIRVCANDNPECCAQVEIVPGCVEACDIFELNVDVSACDSLTMTFAVLINFQWTGDAEFFDVYKGNTFLATIPGAELPFTIDGLTDDGGGALFTVCAHDNDDCCQSVEVSVPQCGEEPCDIFDLVAEAFACDTVTQTFALYIDFQWTGNDEVFNVFKGNVQIGEVFGANLPDTLYGLTDDGGGALITVCADTHPDCCASVEISVPDCGAEEECEIYEVDVNTGDCTGDSTFAVAITFLYQGFQNEFVDIWTGDTYLGFFNVNNQPIIINEFPWNGQEVMPLRICENDNQECCRIVEFAVPDCLFGQEECGIFEVSVDPIDCTSDSTFAAWVNFIAQGFDGPVQIWAGDTYLGLFAQDLPLLVTDIPENDGGILLTICQAENQECCAVHEFQGLNCENIGDIQNLSAIISECDNGLFDVTLDFDYENVSDSFIVAGNGNLYGTFPYTMVPVTIGSLPGDNVTQYEFAVRDKLHPLWYEDVNIGLVDCTTGLFDTKESTALEVQYGAYVVHVVIPEGAIEMSMWAYDGRALVRSVAVMPESVVDVSRFVSVPGLYVVQVKTETKTYVGKVVIIGD